MSLMELQHQVKIVNSGGLIVINKTFSIIQECNEIFPPFH